MVDVAHHDGVATGVAQVGARRARLDDFDLRQVGPADRQAQRSQTIVAQLRREYPPAGADMACQRHRQRAIAGADLGDDGTGLESEGLDEARRCRRLHPARVPGLPQSEQGETAARSSGRGVGQRRGMRSILVRPPGRSSGRPTFPVDQRWDQRHPSGVRFVKGARSHACHASRWPPPRHGHRGTRTRESGLLCRRARHAPGEEERQPGRPGHLSPVLRRRRRPSRHRSHVLSVGAHGAAARGTRPERRGVVDRATRPASSSGASG